MRHHYECGQTREKGDGSGVLFTVYGCQNDCSTHAARTPSGVLDRTQYDMHDAVRAKFMHAPDHPCTIRRHTETTPLLQTQPSMRPVDSV